jgi:hypothetical protein
MLIEYIDSKIDVSITNGEMSTVVPLRDVNNTL